MNEILLDNGMILDGTGAAARRGRVLIRGERIAAVGEFTPPADAKKTDCTGLTVAPGFIDIHSHSDVAVLANRREKANQGVTTEVVGNCGFSPYPYRGDKRAIQDYASFVFLRGDWGWGDARKYLKAVAERARVVGALSLVGHGSLRVAVAGQRQGALSPAEMDAAEQILSESLSAGAAGFSTGLMYAPGSSAPPEELVRLCRVVARHEKMYATHMRSYAWQLLESVDEQIQLTRGTGCRLQISHLQAVGHANWHKQEQALEKIEKARHEGVDVAFDIYPYQAGSTTLTQFLPQAALDGGAAAMVARLKDPAQRKRIAAEVRQMTAQQWTDVYITAVESERNEALVGKNVGQIAEMRKSDPVETMMDLLIEERGAVTIISFNQSEDNLRRLLTHPLCVVGSDGFYVKGRPHPRLYGTFPSLLGSVVREKGWMKLPEAVHKITGLAAERMRLKDRGRIEAGYIADVTVFDAAKVASPATYEAPEKAPEGIRMVFRQGQMVTGA